MSTEKRSLWRVLSDTSRIISAHSRHFLALSILFLLPASVATIIYSFFWQPASVHSHYRRYASNVVVTEDSDVPHVGKSQLLIQLLYILLVQLFNLCAVSSITYSTFNGFYDRPVRLISSLKSILVSFFPLLSTLLVMEIIMGLIVFAFGILVLLAYNGLALFGYENNSLVFVMVFAALLVGLLIYLQLEWFLTNAVVVLESRWGFAPLKRSSYLVKGTRGVVFLMILFFAIPSGLLSIWYMNVVTNAGRINEGWNAWVVLQMVVFVGVCTLISLYSLAASTVLFVYCKEFHEELALQIDEKFGGGYVRLPFDVV